MRHQTLNLFVILTILLCGTALYGQLRVGLSAGINFASLSTNEDTFDIPDPLGYPVRRTLSVISTVDIGLPGEFWLRLQPSWLEQGSQIEQSGSKIGRTELQYLHLPIMCLFQLHERPSPYFFAGPAVAILLNADQQGLPDSATSFKDKLESTDLSLNFGGGIEFPVGAVTATAEIQYALGLVDIERASSVILKTSGLRFLFGFSNTF